jgi:hypothetical protein
MVRPKALFFVWTRSLEGGVPESTEMWASVYLVAAGEDEKPTAILRRCFASIFEEQLEGWHRVIDCWPKPRTIAMFQAWFDAEIVDLIFDVAEGPIEHDD